MITASGVLVFFWLAFLVVTPPSLVKAASGIDSAVGSDLPINAGNTLALTVGGGETGGVKAGDVAFHNAVGIGTKNARAPLNVINSRTFTPTANNLSAIQIGGPSGDVNGGGLLMKDSSYYGGLWTSNAGASLQLGAGGTTSGFTTSGLITITSSGYIGMGGVTAPSFPIDMYNPVGNNRTVFHAGYGGKNDLFLIDNSANITSNVYYMGGWRYYTSNPGVRLMMANGTYIFYTCPNGPAGGVPPMTVALTISNEGHVSVGTGDTGYNFYVNGTAAGLSAYHNLSDARLKKDVQPITLGLDAVMKLMPVGFNWIKQEQSWKKSHQIGLIAQDVEKVVPEAVLTNDRDDMKSIAYSTLVPVLIKSVQELNAKVDQQANEIKKLKEQIKTDK